MIVQIVVFISLVACIVAVLDWIKIDLEIERLELLGSEEEEESAYYWQVHKQGYPIDIRN